MFARPDPADELVSNATVQAELVVGPLLRYVGTTTATIWVETSSPAEITVLGHRARTFHVEGHHYALVLIEDLEPGTVTPYEVRLDGRLVWPPSDGRPAPAIRTRQGEQEARLIFGSCRVGAPERPPFSLSPTEHAEGHRGRCPLGVFPTTAARRRRLARRAVATR